MPALTMKNKLSRECVGQHNLHVSCKSTKISKHSCPQVKSFEEAAVLDIYIQNHQHGSSNIDVSGQNIVITEANDFQNKLDDASVHILKASSSSGPISIGRMGSLSATCPSNMETIFSPSLEDNNSQLKLINHSNAGKTAETSSIYVEGSYEETMMNSDDARFYLAIHQLKSSDEETQITCHSGNLDEMEFFDPQLVFRSLPDLPEAVSSICPISLPKETQRRKPITLVLDLDETLVHSTLEHCDNADFTFQVFFNMKQHTVYVRRRPHLQLFLERVAQMFEIVIFTASQSIYAEQLLDMLDPEKKLISQRIYRESCIFSDGSYTKDLTILGVNLAKVVIIDNSPQVFRLQVNNGIPIKSWFDDPSDHALLQLLPFLESLADADDVRPIIAKKFGNKE
ncbi:uncharacterized protein [Elaeis guineensis]|uniref:CTD small phosphatase-like protein 3 isoform X2 n=1 Tax=Elaeis guineensis var. tenera TaxID=51953 RepID=A0A6I9RIC4_ELAGV|nr:CTD small phosphatase-like protein 3 isoform X2 [Elaeis guineensis]